MGKKSRNRRRAESRRAARENEVIPQENVDSCDDVMLPTDATSSDENSDQLSQTAHAMMLPDSPRSPNSSLLGSRPSRLPVRVSSIALSPMSLTGGSPSLSGDKKSRIPRLISLRDLAKTRSNYNNDEGSDESHLESVTSSDSDDLDDYIDDNLPEHHQKPTTSRLTAAAAAETAAAVRRSRSISSSSSSDSESCTSSFFMVPDQDDTMIESLPRTYYPFLEDSSVSITSLCIRIPLTRFLL